MRSGNDPGRFRETMHWVRVGATLAVLVLAVVGIRSCVSERGGVHAPTPEERLAAAAERMAKAMEPATAREADAWPRAANELAGSDEWSLMLVEERGGCTATLFIDGHSHHGHGATRDEAEAAALEAWHAATGGPRA